MTTYKEYLCLFSMILLLFISITFMSNPAKSVMSRPVPFSKDLTIVIDAGHGGFDSGKVGIDGTLEKNINLSIAKKLEKLLLASDINVVMTRTTDAGLYEESSSNKKRQDMTNRASIMNTSNAQCVISIHQNSYPEESIHGAQVFYYTDSEPGNLLATLIQKELVHDIDPQNHRVEKANSSYYLLKNVSVPIVIVECGFLSNQTECKKLVDDSYQQKLAWAIHMGILQYLNGVTIN